MNFGDTPGWVRIAEAIASQDFAGIHVKQFRGASYPAAALIKLTGLSGPVALLIVGFASSLLALVPAHRVDWGVALSLNFDRFRRSFPGDLRTAVVAPL
jgi:hypothetical protein